MLSVCRYSVVSKKKILKPMNIQKNHGRSILLKISFLKSILTEEYEAMIGAGIFFIFLKRMMKEIIILMKRIMCIYDDSDGIYDIDEWNIRKN